MIQIWTSSNMKTYTTHSEEETKTIAATFAKTLVGGQTIELVGDLGSGKTAFVRGVVEALGSNVRVKSPTFTVMNEYPIQHHAIKRVLHLDLYRFNNPMQLESLALSDNKRSDTIIFIEWPDIFVKPAVTADKRIEFTFIDENTRTITL